MWEGQAYSFGKPITDYDPASRGAQAYRDFAAEFERRSSAAGAPA